MNVGIGRCVLVAGTLLRVSTDGLAAERDRPNFIVILADDQGYNDLGCYGSAYIRTPNIDKMAANGIRFTNFYAQPVSGPSRAALLTGCYPLRIAEVGNKKLLHPMVHPEEILIPELLATCGYVSGCIGKWDINGHSQSFAFENLMPTRMGFDYWFGLPSSIDNGVERVYRNEELVTEKITVDSLTQIYTREALTFIEKNRTTPFFLYLAHSMPHTRLGASSSFKGRSNLGLYGDAVEELDWSVGEILKKVQELGLADNTYIIYTSDNGPWAARGIQGGSAYPLRGDKISTWEGGVRVPCVIYSGAIREKGVVCDQITSTMDFFPTFAAMSGATMPKERVIDGVPIPSLLKRHATAIPGDTYYYYIDTHLQGVRKGQWKLVLPRPQAPEWVRVGKKSIWNHQDMDPVRDLELYNLEKDPAERRDVAATNYEIVKSLYALIEKARSDIGDYNVIGKGARFFDTGEHRPDAKLWQEKELGGWKQPIRLHPYYDDGGRIL